MTKKEIIQLLIVNHKAFVDATKNLDGRSFEIPKGGKWSPGEQLDHIVKSIEPLNMALALPKWMVRVVGGKASKPSRTYAQLVRDYEVLLDNGAKSTKKYEPGNITADRKDGLVYQLEQMTMSLCESVDGFTEEQLDKLRLPHPLLGKLTIREMLYFAAYHVKHHHEQMLKNLAK